MPSVAKFEEAGGNLVKTGASLIPDEFGDALDSGVGDFVGDQEVSWEATLITACASLVIALLFVMLLR